MNPRMLGGARLKVYAGPPRLAQGVGGGAHHAGQRLYPVELAERRLRQHRRDGLPKRVVIDGPRQPASEPRCQLLEGHDLQPVSTLPRGFEPKLAHALQAVGNDRATCHFFHSRPTRSCMIILPSTMN